MSGWDDCKFRVFVQAESMKPLGDDTYDFDHYEDGGEEIMVDTREEVAEVLKVLDKKIKELREVQESGDTKEQEGGFKSCDCGCCHAADHGACPTFEEGANGRCVYCDHGRQCHPGKGPSHNTPL